MIKLLYILVLLLVFGMTRSFADSGVSLGMAGAYSALSRGVDALYWNPANLALRDGGLNGSMTLFSVTVGVGNNSLSRSIYDEYFTDENKVLTQEDVDRLLEHISDDGLIVETLTDVSLFSFAAGNFAFGFSTSGVSESTVPRQMLKVPLQGLSAQTYVFQPTASAEALGKIHVACGQSLVKYRTLYVFNRPVLDIDDIAVGVRFSYLFGLASFRSEQAQVETLMNDSGISAKGTYYGVGSYLENGSLPGTGMAMDLGFSVTMPGQYTFSLVVSNVYNRITWRNNTKAWSGELDTGTPRFLLGDNSLVDVDGDEIFTDDEIDISEYVTSSPVDVRLGLGQHGRNGMYALEMGSRDQRFLTAVGGGYSWAILHLYGGFRYCGGSYFHGGVGLGGEAFMLDVGLASRGGLTQSASKGVILACSMRVGW